MHGFPQGQQRRWGPERKITQQICVSEDRKRLEVSLDLDFGGQDPVPPGLPFKGQRSPFLLSPVSWLRSPLGLESAAAHAAFGFGHCRENPRARESVPSRGWEPLTECGATQPWAPGYAARAGIQWPGGAGLFSSRWTEGPQCAKLPHQRGWQVKTGAASRARLIQSL